jgi:hypothetical protein
MRYGVLTILTVSGAIVVMIFCEIGINRNEKIVAAIVWS